jgi:peptidoglycan/xylan/chitin deacetylase (PgdA/CDA1 family)
MEKFPVLMYHRLVSDECPVPGGDEEEARYAVELDVFRRQLEFIARSGRRGVSMRQAHEALQDGRVPSDWVVVTFDDGNLSDYVHARPLLLDMGFNGTFFVGGDRVGADGGLTGEMISRMANDGLDIGSHGMSHRFLSVLSAEEESIELEESKRFLEEVSGGEVHYFAPPGGRIGRRGIGTLKRLSYRAVCTSEFGFNDSTRERFEFRRVPVTAATSLERFRDFVETATLRLVPLYVRARTLRLARGLLGESLYRRVRSVGLRS